MKISIIVHDHTTETRLIKSAQAIMLDAGLVKKTKLIGNTTVEARNQELLITADTEDGNTVSIRCPIDQLGTLHTTQVTLVAGLCGSEINMMTEVRRHPIKNSIRYTMLMMYIEKAYALYCGTMVREERIVALRRQESSLKKELLEQKYNSLVSSALEDQIHQLEEELVSLITGA